jgi:hypothetical protein
MIATSPPITQAIWKRVSNFANARPRAASGPSRWSRLSNPSRPDPPPTESANPASTKPNAPATNAPSSAKVAGSTRAEAMITSSRAERRSTGALITPRKFPAMLAAPTTNSAGRSCLRENALKNTRKPTDPRSTAIALPPSRMLGVCSS